MTTLLSSFPHSPFGGSLVTTPCLSPASPSSVSLTRNEPDASAAAVDSVSQRRTSSSGSYTTVISARGSPLRVRNENSPPKRSVSSPILDVHRDSKDRSRPRSSALILRDTSSFDDVDVTADYDRLHLGSHNELIAIFEKESAQELSQDINAGLYVAEPIAAASQIDFCQGSRTASNLKGNAARPFVRWMSTLRRKNLAKGKSLTVRTQRWCLDDNEESSVPKQERQSRAKHQKTSSTSSSAFITAVKTASVSLASFSVAPGTRQAARSSRLRAEYRSSGQSQNEHRESTDIAGKVSEPFMDEAAWDRALRRRKVLEELVSSEESYVADLKVLTNVST